MMKEIRLFLLYKRFHICTQDVLSFDNNSLEVVLINKFLRNRCFITLFIRTQTTDCASTQTYSNLQLYSRLKPNNVLQRMIVSI